MDDMVTSPPPQKIYIKTLGCKVNTFDSRVLENQFRAKGYEIISDAAEADVQIINSCSVTANAEKEARYLLRRFQRENPKSLRVITGCYAQIHSSTLRDMAEVDFVVPNEVKNELLPLLEARMRGEQEKLPSTVKAVKDNRQSQFKSSVVVFDEAISDQTRAYLKVQDGCNGFCAYCQIPYARGASRSVPPQQVLTEVRRLVAQGVPELVLTGIHVGDYGRDLLDKEDTTDAFVELVRSILAEKGLQQVRISSLEPMEVSEELLKVLKAEGVRFCDHFHLPLQSGCDRILKLMRRSYNCAEYAETIDMIRSYFPEVHISADVIVGFPQESDEDFAETEAFIEKLGLGSLHVFPYSKRPNTLAEKLPGHLSPEQIRLRVARLRELSSKLHHTYASRFIGREMSVLWEKQTDAQGRVLGKTRNYLSVAASRSHDFVPLAASISTVTLKGFLDEKTLLALDRP